MATVKDWMKPIRNAEESSSLRELILTDPNYEVAVPMNPSFQQRRIMNAVKFLETGARRHKNIQADTLLRNFELMAFAISWFGMVSQFCKSCTQLVELSQNNASDFLESPSTLVEVLKQ
jgi:hypothetical protein